MSFRAKVAAAAIAATTCLGLAGAAAAQTCSPGLYNLQNGQTADAQQLMTNFNCVLGSPNFTGPVGIGKATPRARLDFGNATTFPADMIGLYENGAAVKYGIGIDISGAQNGMVLYSGDRGFVFKTGALANSVGSNLMTITPAGGVGIGTPYPQNLLELKNNGGWTPGLRIGNGTGYWQIGVGVNAANDSLIGFYDLAHGASRFVIDGAGNVGIGTTTPGNLLELRNSGAGTPGLRISNGNGSWQLGVGINAANDSLVGFYDIAHGANRFVIDGSGNVGIGTTTPSYTLTVNGTAYATGAAGSLSDLRHKDKIETLKPGALGLVQKLRAVSFVWKEPKDDGMRGEQIGFIAQEVQKVLPSVVLTEKDKDQTLSIKYSELIPVMAAAIQEQQAKIAALEARLAKLEGRR